MAKNTTRTALRPTLISLAVASCFATGTAIANPTGETLVRGTANFHRAGNLLQITNSPNAIINWQSFSIGANEITRFLQQSPSSAVLNRVTTQNPSEILGSLQSKLLDGVTTGGRVFLINPNGILFGAGAQIDVGGLVASTLRMSDDDFLAGRMRFGDGLGKSVVNDGSIATGAGGSVYLIGSGVTNNGIIRSPQGEVVLAAGNSVELVSPGTPNLRVEIAALDNEARNLGQIISDAGRIGIYAGLVNNAGTVRADSAVSEGGRILLKASKSVTLENTSVLSAQGQGGGEIKVLADESVRVAGRLDASAPNGGDGGFIETSGKSFSIDPSAVITTTAPLGKTGAWLIDPLDFIIAPAGTPGDITGTALGTLLLLNNVVITSDGLVLPLPEIPGRVVGLGDIVVNDRVAWGGNTTLTLAARNDVNITVNGTLTHTGCCGGGVVLLAGWDGVNPQAPSGVVPGVGDINVNTGISTFGNVLMRAGRDISVNSSINAGNTSFSSWTLALEAGNKIALGVEATLDVSGGEGSVATASLTAGAGGISMENGTNIVRATGGGTCCGVGGGSANVSMSTSGNITLNSSASVEALGGNNGGGSGADGGSATISMSAGGTLSIVDSSVLATGGSGGGTTGNGGAATISLNAANVMLSGSLYDISADGGSAACCLAGTVGSGGAGMISIAANGNITAAGTGSGVIVTSGGSTGIAGGSGANASLSLSAGGIIDLTGGQFLSIGANGGNGNGGPSSVGGNASVSLGAGSGVSLNRVNIFASAGGSNNALGGSGTTTVTTNSGNILAQNSTFMSADGAEGGSGALSLMAPGQVTLDNSFASAGGGSFGPGNGGAAAVSIAANGGATIVNNGGVRAFGGGSFNTGTTGGAAAVTIATNGGAILLQNASNAVDGSGGFGQSIGGSAAVTMMAANGMTFDSANVTATGNMQSPTPGTGLVSLSAGNGTIEVLNGSDVNANGSLINLTFTGRSTGGFFVNGVEGAIVDDPTRPTMGFFVNGLPAVLGQNLIVTYLNNVTFTDTLIASMNQQADVLADQLKAGETGEDEDKEKKKLPFCNS